MSTPGPETALSATGVRFINVFMFMLLFLRYLFQLDGSHTSMLTSLVLCPVPEVIHISSPSLTELPPWPEAVPLSSISAGDCARSGSQGLEFLPRSRLTVEPSSRPFSEMY